ncbi:MAG: heparinase II/III family protein [Pricia sp.]
MGKSILLLIFSILAFFSNAQEKSRPFIWVDATERLGILEKIKAKPWAASYFKKLKERADKAVSEHQQDSEAFLRQMPLDWDNQQKNEIPPLTYTKIGVPGEHRNLDNATKEELANFEKLSDYLQMAVDCGVLYYLIQEDEYARCGLDILHTAISGLVQLQPSEWEGRGGWLCPDDLLRETRKIGEKFPIAYDFVASFINEGGQPYDLGKKVQVPFPTDKAQKVFRTYARLVVEHGMINSNHPVLESNCLVYNALAINEEEERKHYLKYYLNESTPRQDALAKVALSYEEEGDIWPETSQYTNDVARRTTKLMYLLTKYNPSLHLGQEYPNIPWALQRLDYLVYPNGELILWGDGHRDYDTPFEAYELAFALGKIDSVDKLTRRFGSLLGRAMATGEYKRKGLEALLWFEDEFDHTKATIDLPRTDEQSHAGIFLQRNLSPSGKPEDGLMCFVGGAPMVHGHASGMNIELYGEGIVMGVDNGRDRYAQDIHENYSRLFAAHNTVIVNGSSQGEGEWVNLGIDTVALDAMEPMPGESAVSPNHSFSTTTFYDRGGDGAEAEQKRTLALIRTSPTTGYYVDIFRSKSKLPNEYHDYLYHNLGESVDFLNAELELRPDPDRYMANKDTEWIRNRKYRNPGWHFFKEVETSDAYSDGVEALFKAERFPDKKRYMKVVMPGFDGRSYTKVMAPRTFEAPVPYHEMETPTLVVRQQGEAWERPFVAVYEPYSENLDNQSVQSVEKLEQNGIFSGLKVVSKLGEGEITQYILIPQENEQYQNEQLGISFQGSFACITLDSSGKLLHAYIGHGKELHVGSIKIELYDTAYAAYVDFSEKKVKIKGNATVYSE